MLRSSALLLLIVPLASSMVVSRRQTPNVDSSAIPTELFQPVQPSAVETTSNSPMNIQSSPIVMQSSPNQNDFEQFFETFKNNDGFKSFGSSFGNQPIFAQQSPIQEVRVQSSSQGLPLITQRWIGDQGFGGPQINSGSNGYYKVSKSSSYYDSTMGEPVVQNFEYDSRNGGQPPNIGFPTFFNS